MTDYAQRIEQYYLVSTPAYRNWGADPEREGVYGLHCGYYEEGIDKDNHLAVKDLTRRLIGFSGATNPTQILDAGCGTGALAFELGCQFPQAQISGINISLSQLIEAQRYKLAHQIKNVAFGRQDYNHIAFPDTTFDQIFFCESLTHSPYKPQTLREAARVTQPGGVITIAEAYLLHPNLDLELRKQLFLMESGWELGETPTIDQVQDMIAQAGFKDIESVEVTARVSPSIELMAVHAASRLDQSQSDTALEAGRRACIAVKALVEGSALGYFFLRAKRS